MLVLFIINRSNFIFIQFFFLFHDFILLVYTSCTRDNIHQYHRAHHRAPSSSIFVEHPHRASSSSTIVEPLHRAPSSSIIIIYQSKINVVKKNINIRKMDLCVCVCVCAYVCVSQSLVLINVSFIYK